MSPYRDPEMQKANARKYYREHREQIKDYQIQYRETHLEKVKADRRQRYYNNREDAIAKVKVWALENIERKRAYLREYSKAYRAVNKEKFVAQHLALKIPLKMSCEKCESKENLIRHHPDYSKPLIVMTVCKSCHMKIHRGVIVA